MLAGFRSRWMMPCSCAASSASAICFAIGSASSSGIGAVRDAVASVVALDQLQTSAVTPSASLQSVDRRDVRMIQRGENFGLALEARQAVGDPPRATAGRTLIATWRFSFVSVARYTSPMPPAPIRAVTS